MGPVVLKKAIILAFLLILVLTAQPLLAVAPPPEQYDITEEADPVEKLDFEKRLEERLVKDIESYLGHKRFIFKINADLLKNKTILRKPVLNAAASSQPSTRPTKATENAEPLSREIEEKENLMLLPGMPVGLSSKKSTPRAMRQPDNRQSSQAEAASREPVYDYKEEVFSTKTAVKKIMISFIVDQGISGQQEEFIKNLIYNKAQLDTLRGDILQITKSDFPQPLVRSNEYLAYVPYVVVLFFVFLLLILLALVIGQRKNAQKNHVSEIQVAPLQPVPEKAPQTAAAPSPDLESGKIVHLRQEIASLGLGHPELVKKKAREAMDNGGVEKVALLYKGIGFNLARTLFTSLVEREQADIKKYIEDNKDSDNEALAEAMNDFYHSIVYDSLLHSPQKVEIKPFGFLDELDDSQIKYILENEQVRVKALILSQLNPARTASIIKTYPPNVRGQIAVALGDFESIPINVYRDVADKLSKKAIGVPSFTNISADGIDLLVNMLDNLDGASEKSLLDELKTQNPGMYYKLKKVYFTFSDIPRVPKEKLKDILREIDRSSIALSLVDVDPEFKTYVLESLSDKMRAMVEDEIESLGNSVQQKNVEDARTVATRQIRTQIQKEGIVLSN